MIDLSTAVVGDKFVTEDNQECVISLKKGYDICFELLDGADLLFITNEDGVPSNANYHNLRIKSKRDPRHWLGWLPDADLFSGNWLAENNSGGWFCHENEPNREDNNGGVSLYADSGRSVNCLCLKMPTLTGDEWRNSKISIDDLRAWQKENKTRGQ